MHEEYLPKSIEGKRDHIIEEMGEVLLLFGKILRFGPDSYDPTVPEEERETNIDAFHRELDDLQWAIERYKWSRLEKKNPGDLIF